VGDDDLLAGERMPPFLVAARDADAYEAMTSEDLDYLI